MCTIELNSCHCNSFIHQTFHMPYMDILIVAGEWFMVQNSTLTHRATRMLAHLFTVFIECNLCAILLYRVYTLFGFYVARFCIFFSFILAWWMHSVHHHILFGVLSDMLIATVKMKQRKNLYKMNSICWFFFIWTMLCPLIHINNILLLLLLLLIHEIQFRNIHFSFCTYLNV